VLSEDRERMDLTFLRTKWGHQDDMSRPARRLGREGWIERSEGQREPSWQEGGECR
jgi:hypothetical protein